MKPTVIFDEKLYSAQLNSDAKIEVNEIDSAVLGFEYKSKEYNRRSYLIDIVTLDNLSKYLDLIEKRHKNIFNQIANACNAL